MAQTQEQGIQATIQMQLAARRVMHENLRLRCLLRQLAVSDTTVAAWVSGDISGAREHCYTRSEPQMEKMTQRLALTDPQEADIVGENPRNIDRAESSHEIRIGEQDPRLLQQPLSSPFL